MSKKTFHHPSKFSILFIFLVLSSISFLHPEANHVVAQPHDVLYVTFIDVGQGDSALLRTNSGINILIDAGPSSAGQIVVSVLEEHNITALDVIVISHNHADHIGGLINVLQAPIAVDLILYNGNTCTTITCQKVWVEMAIRGIEPTAVRSGDVFVWDSIITEILNPQSVLTGNENEESVVMHVTFDENSILFTGDIGFSTETILINQGRLSSIDILKVAHHGSKYSTSTNFLDLVQPKEAVISVGANNTYGHPSDDTLNRLYNSGAAVFRTDLDGSVSFSFSGGDHEDPVEFLIFLPFLSHYSVDNCYDQNL